MSTIAISYPLALPTTPAPANTDINLDYLGVGFDLSPFSGAGQAHDFGGRVWRAKIDLPLMRRAVADEWLAFFSKLRGPAGWFLMGDFDRRVPRGTIAGTPAVMGASQSGNGLAIDGCTAFTTWLRGDMFQLESRLYRIVENFTADSGGAGILQFEPSLRSAPANDALLTYQSPKGLWRLTQSYIPSPSDAAGAHKFSFEAIEKL